MLLYKQTARIIYVGCRSMVVNIQRGVCQRCPLSPLLFDIIIELFALAVRVSADVYIVSIDTVEHKLVLYADVTFFFSTACRVFMIIE